MRGATMNFTIQDVCAIVIAATLLVALIFGWNL